MTAGRIHKHDLILLKDDTAQVVDVQITGYANVEVNHDEKVDKYQISVLEDEIKNRYSLQKVKYVACTLSFKDI